MNNEQVHSVDAADELEPLQALEANRRLVELLIDERRSVIHAARLHGASWEAIGVALGISRQGAHDWYSRQSLGQGAPESRVRGEADGSQVLVQRAPRTVLPHRSDQARAGAADRPTASRITTSRTGASRMVVRTTRAGGERDGQG